MTDKKNKRKEKKSMDGDRLATQSDSLQTQPDAEALQAQLSESQARAQEYLDALMRERADFTNFRRRVEQEKSTLWSQASGETIKKFLPVLDDLDRALQNRPPEDGWANGVELIYRKFQSLLDKEGVTPILAEGQLFDPNLHEAILQEPSDTHASGTVIAVLQQGYLQGGRVLRPALVKVAQ